MESIYENFWGNLKENFIKNQKKKERIKELKMKIIGTRFTNVDVRIEAEAEHLALVGDGGHQAPGLQVPGPVSADMMISIEITWYIKAKIPRKSFVNSFCANETESFGSAR